MRHVPEVLARLEVIPHDRRAPDLRRARALRRPLPRGPGRDHRPVPLPRERRPPRRDGLACSTPTRSRAHGIEVLDPSALGRDELLAAGPRPTCAIEAEICAARVPQGWASTAAPCRPTSRSFVADHLRAERHRADASTTDEFVAPPAGQDRRRSSTASGARRRPPTPRWASPRALIRELRAGPDAPRRCASAMQAVCEEHGCELPDDVIVSHGAQSAIGHESGFGRDRAPASRWWSTSGRATRRRAAGPT